MLLTQSDLNRFWTKVTKTDTCWIWNGAKSNSGYGRFKINKILYSPHRISFIIHNQEIPKELWVLHDCDNRSCVNPDHLFLGSRSDNMVDCGMKNRTYKQQSENKPLFSGENCHKHKLTEKDVIYIRQLFNSGNTIAEITRMFPKVTRNAINCIVKETTWKHLL